MATGNRSLVIALTLIATLGGLLFGYDTAVISGAISSIDANFINPRNLDEAARNSLSGFTISSALWGCVLGGLIAGWIGDRLGRRPGLMLAAAMFLICSIGSAWPELGLGAVGSMGTAALLPFNIYRVIGGIGVGMASLLAPLYIAEIAPPKERGQLVSYQQLAIVGGMMLVYFVNYAIAAHGDEAWLHASGWRWMLASEAVPALLFLVLLLGVPDSPRWLVMKSRDAEARALLTRLTDAAEARLVLREIEESLVVKHERLFHFGGLVILVGVLLSVFQQLVGINAVLYYAPLMFKNMGSSTDSALLQTVIVGVANVVFTVVAMLSVDRWGRKPLLILGAIIMAVAMLSLGALFNAHNMGTTSLLMVILYIAGFALSWGPIVWVMLAEIFPNSIKGVAMGLAVAVQWFANLAVSWSFKVLDGNSALNAQFNHGFAYFVYGVMSILAALFVWRYVPETKGRHLEQIQNLWRRTH
ncbi:MAG TPA: D-xylose transporter XylE [Steroidobacteraceae bacterium]|jgi:MFS transporter, SP family, xylose:H+ symportor|nr:D-xylose transporter XylE [Steroidobacteraceae bacterium]